MLTVKNVTQDTMLVENGRVANNPWTRLRGLIGVRKLSPGDGILISPCNGVHCMFMSIPIDVVHVDKENRVLALSPNMRPWRVGRVYRRSKCVVELPSGTIARTHTAIGDHLQVTFS